MTQLPQTDPADSDPDEKAERLMAAARRAVRAAVREHKLLGNPIAARCDGKTVWIQPEDIEI